MKTVAVVGTQWGDEGKGKIIDMLAAHADVVVRYQGGNNAAHTIVVDGEKFILRLVPAGALHPDKLCVIGNGAVVDPVALLAELDDLKRRRGFDPMRLRLSYEAHMVLPYHRAIDQAREARAGKRAIGTTGFGIGPAYEDKMSRVGLRFEDLLNPRAFEDNLKRNISEKNAYLKAVLKAKPVPGAVIVDALKRARKRLLPLLSDTGELLAEAIRADNRILFEGAHGTMLDIDHGTYPYVTSSNCIASGVFGGSGLGPGSLEAVLGISKAYTTRVGAGPFPTEISGYLADSLREEGVEFGSATGRPRRIGWFDAPLARFAARVNGLWALAVTKLDVLTGLDPVKVCVGYQYKGKRYDTTPPGRAALQIVKAIYEELPGWQEPLGEIRSLGDLPENARRYVERIGELVALPIAMIGIGAAREATIVLKNPFDA